MKQLSLQAPQLRPARFEDYKAIARFGMANSLNSQSVRDWQSMWLDNPVWSRLGKNWHIGWILESTAGDIVGTILNVPSLYTFRGQSLVCGNGRAWATTPEYRGYALWLMDEYFNQPQADLFINTTVGPTAAQIIDTLATRIPLGDWATGSTWVIAYAGFVKQALRSRRMPFADLVAYPASGVLWLKHAIFNKSLPRSQRAVEIETVDSFDARFDVLWDEIVRQKPETLLADRSSNALSWHFNIPRRSGRLWIFTASRNRQVRAYCILICTSDGRQVHFVDYQSADSDIDMLPGLLRAALRRCAREGVQLLRNVGRGVPKMRAMDECATYRNTFSNWRFYYRAADPSLHSELRVPQYWDPSVYNGDASFK